MNNSRRFSDLPPTDQWLIRTMQDVAFGRLHFAVRSGSADPAQHQIVRTRKLLGGGGDAPRPEATKTDFALRAEHVALLEHLRGMPDGTRVSVKIAVGLPTTSIDIEDVSRVA